MSLAEHTRIRLEGRGGLTKIGQIVVDSLNEMARAHFAGEALPNHSPSSPAFWFAGLARENAAPFNQFKTDAPLASPTIRATLSDEAVQLARQTLACSCEARWGTWTGTVEDGHPFACYPCAFDAHGMCVHGCTADFEVLRTLDAELQARSLPAYERPQFVAVLDEPGPLTEAVAHVLRYGKLGKRSRDRLKTAYEAVTA